MSSTEQTGTVTNPDIVVETFNEQEVIKMVDGFDILGQNVYNSIKDMDSAVASNVQVGSGAIAGKLGGVLFSEWSESCVPMLNFKRFFDGISESMRRIYNRSSETYDAIDTIYKDQNPEDTNPAAIGDSSMDQEISMEAGIGNEQAAVLGQDDEVSTGGEPSNGEVAEELVENPTVATPAEGTEETGGSTGAPIKGAASTLPVADQPTEVVTESPKPEVTEDDLPVVVKPANATQPVNENEVEMSIQ